MPTEPRSSPEPDDIEHELRKLRGFGRTLGLAFGVTLVLILTISLALWLVLF